MSLTNPVLSLYPYGRRGHGTPKAGARVPRLRQPGGAVCLAILIAWSPAARGQDAATRGIVQWKDGAIATPQQDAAAQSQAVESALRSGARHVVMQFDRPLAPGQHQEVAKVGITLLSYLGDNAFFAAVAPGRGTARLARIDGLRWVLPIQQNWKLHPALSAGQIPEWAIVERDGSRVRGFKGARMAGWLWRSV